jgi:signal transduction histidine kinase
LPPLVRDLEIDYTALSLVAPEKNRFRVKLEGRDRDWKDAGTRRQAFYSDLAPRNYRFRVIAGNNSGVWNEAGASFDFSIAPAYYQTAWFRVSCVAAFLALLWALYRFRLHQVAREFNMRMEERVGERTRLARDLHDTLLQGFQGLILRLQAVDDLLPPGEAKEELEQTLDRADEVVTESRKAVHDLRLSTVVTNDLARAVRTLGDELSNENSATFGFLVEGQVHELHPIVRDEVYRITREALRNAFSHARARHIEAELICAERLLRLRIRDDGEGIAPAILEGGRPGHYGLPGMRERAAEIGAQFGYLDRHRKGDGDRIGRSWLYCLR